MPVFPMPEKFEKGVHMFAKMYAITAITRCMYCSRYLYKQERRISMLESLTSSKILEYKNTEEGSSRAKSSFELVWTVQYLSIMGKTLAQIHKNQTVNYKNPEIKT